MQVGRKITKMLNQSLGSRKWWAGFTGLVAINWIGIAASIYHGSVIPVCCAIVGTVIIVVNGTWSLTVLEWKNGEAHDQA